MIDPKQENENMDIVENPINTLNIELNNARAEIIKYERMHNDSYQDHQVMLHMLQHFTMMFVERGQEDIIKDALEYAYDCTTSDWEELAEIVDRLGIADPALCQRQYNVTVTVPVEVTVNVFATSPDDAEDRAKEEIDSNGLDNYHMEYDVYYSADFDVEEA